MKLGDQIVYTRDDSGGVLDAGAMLDDGTTLNYGIQLIPGQPLTVGAEIPLGFAERLCEDGHCTLVQPAAKASKTELVPADDEKSKGKTAS